MAKQKIGVLFGAGAEIALGMPNGGEFAGNILFPSDDIRDKAQAEYEARTSGSQFRTFTSTDLKSVMSSTLEKKRVEIGRFFRHFFMEQKSSTSPIAAIPPKTVLTPPPKRTRSNSRCAFLVSVLALCQKSCYF